MWRFVAKLIVVVVIVIALAGLLNGLNVGFPSTANAHSQKREKWEYSRVAISGDTNTAIWFGPDGTELEAANYTRLAEKLGLKIRAGHSIAFLNALGDDGWELVSHEIQVVRSSANQYVTLKRKK